MTKKNSIIISLLCLSSWLGAQSLDFAQALELTLRNNYGINISRLDLQQTGNNNTLGNAGLLPTLNADGQYDIGTRNTDITFFDGSQISRPDAQSQNLGAQAALEWTVFDGFRMWARRSELMATEELAEQELRAQVEIATLDLAQIYYQLIFEEQLIDVYHENLKVSQSRLTILNNSKRVGSASGLDVDQALIDVYNDSITLMEQQNRVQNLQQDLWMVLGDTTDLDYVVNDEIATDTTLRFQNLKDSLYELNSDLLASRSQVEINQSLVQQARSRFYPEVSLFGNYSYNYAQNEAGQLQQLRSFGPTAGVRVQFNLFNGFNDQRLLRNAQLNVEDSKIKLQQTRQQAVTNLRKSFNNYEYYLSVLQLREENLQRAQKTVDVGLKQLQLGVINSIDFRTVQLNFLQAETDLFRAQYNAKLAEIQLLILSGEFSLNLR